jgi:hypothetical protein
MRAALGGNSTLHKDRTERSEPSVCHFKCPLTGRWIQDSGTKRNAVEASRNEVDRNSRGNGQNSIEVHSYSLLSFNSVILFGLGGV